jgi:hypothetical protein
MRKHKVGVGDEVFVVGLFTYAPGSKRNLPIVRPGNIAMIPDEQIQVDGEFTDAYLIEARSIGGISGPPVFVRPSMALDEARFGLGNKRLIGLSSELYLLGLMHAHWDIKESEMNRPSAIHDRQRGVNMGIGVVVPAQKILETMMHPEISKMLTDNDAKLLQEGALDA